MEPCIYRIPWLNGPHACAAQNFMGFQVEIVTRIHAHSIWFWGLFFSICSFFYSEAMSSMKGSTMADAVRDAIINKVSK